METNYENLNQSILIKLTGNFDVKDFTEILNIIELAYNRLNSLTFISEDFDKLIEGISFSERHKIFINPKEFYNLNISSSGYLDTFNSIVNSAINRTSTLKIKCIKINSPGLIEFIGNLNPLKVIADFITSWRHENTLREDNKNKW